MSKVIKKERDFIILNHKKILQKSELSYFKKLIDERLMGKPMAYLLGKKEFWKHEFVVSKDVLIPRPDSELIIEQVLKLSKYKSKLKILEIGTGSGCLLLSVLKEIDVILPPFIKSGFIM